MNSIINAVLNIYNLQFIALYNNIKICINPNIVDEEELDIEFHGNKSYLYRVNKDI